VYCTPATILGECMPPGSHVISFAGLVWWLCKLHMLAAPRLRKPVLRLWSKTQQQCWGGHHTYMARHTAWLTSMYTNMPW